MQPIYKDGFTDFRLSEVGIIRFLAEHSRKAIAVMDSSELGKRAKCKALDVGAVERLIMDNQVTEGTREKYREKGAFIEWLSCTKTGGSPPTGFLR